MEFVSAKWIPPNNLSIAKVYAGKASICSVMPDGVQYLLKINAFIAEQIGNDYFRSKIEKMPPIYHFKKTGDKYKVLKTVSENKKRHSKCLLVKNQLHQLRLLKVIPKQPKYEKAVAWEIKIGLSVNRANRTGLVRCFKCHTVETSPPEYVLVLEWCPYGDLHQFSKQYGRFPLGMIVTILRQLMREIDFLHRNNIMHGDLKLSNIYIYRKPCFVKLGDFGLSLQLEHQYVVCHHGKGTPNYMAPETVKEGHRSLKTDIWALGIVLYTMFVGRPPFECSTREETFEAIVAGRYHFPSHVFIPPAAKDLISSLLHLVPNQRPSAAEILQHPFLFLDVKPFHFLMSERLLIGLCGKAGHGKSTVANYLVEKHGFKELTVAYLLKKVACTLFDWNMTDLNCDEFKQAIDPMWGVTRRKVLQRLGDVIREDIPKRLPELEQTLQFENLFLHRLAMEMKKIPKTIPIVISDIRFQQERVFLKEHQGYLVRIVRPTKTEQKNYISEQDSHHVSETEQEEFQVDHTIANAGSLESLYQSVNHTVNLFNQ